MPVWLDGVEQGVFGDASVSGTLSTNLVQSIASGDILRLKGNGTGYVAIGAGVSSRGHDGPGDLFVSNELEVDGQSFFDGTLWMNSSVVMSDGITFNFNSTAVGGRMRSDNSIGQMSFLLGPPEGRHLAFGDVANGANKDYDHALQTHPTIFIHSVTDPNTDNTQYLGLLHNTVDAKNSIGKGGHVTNHEAPVSLADDASFTLPDASTGFGFFMIGDNQEYAQVVWSADGTPELVTNSTNVAIADTDGNLCFIDGGTQISVKNRLGATLECMFDYHYTT